MNGLVEATNNRLVWTLDVKAGGAMPDAYRASLASKRICRLEGSNQVHLSSLHPSSALLEGGTSGLAQSGRSRGKSPIGIACRSFPPSEMNTPSWASPSSAATGSKMPSFARDLIDTKAGSPDFPTAPRYVSPNHRQVVKWCSVFRNDRFAKTKENRSRYIEMFKYIFREVPPLPS